MPANQLKRNTKRNYGTLKPFCLKINKRFYPRKKAKLGISYAFYFYGFECSERCKIYNDRVKVEEFI